MATATKKRSVHLASAELPSVALDSSQLFAVGIVDHGKLAGFIKQCLTSDQAVDYARGYNAHRRNDGPYEGKLAMIVRQDDVPAFSRFSIA